MKHNYNIFTASNRWLKSFCLRHQIKFSTLHREGAQVSHEAMDQWLRELLTIMKDYELRNILNCAETSIFFHALPNKSLQGPGEKPVGNKVSKDTIFPSSMCQCSRQKREIISHW